MAFSHDEITKVLVSRFCFKPQLIYYILGNDVCRCFQCCNNPLLGQLIPLLAGYYLPAARQYVFRRFHCFSLFRAFFLFLSVLCFLIWLFVSSDFFYSSWLVGMKTTTKVNENHQFCYFFAQIFVALRFLENDERAP